MERMENFKDKVDRLVGEYIEELEEENKKLKEELETATKCSSQEEGKLRNLEKENKKLNIKVSSLGGEIKGLNYTIEKLKEENQTLELWLDNKEKLNEEYRKELKNYVYDAKQVRDIC